MSQPDEQQAFEWLKRQAEADQREPKPDFAFVCSIGGCAGMLLGPALLLVPLYFLPALDIDNPVAFFLESTVLLILAVPLGATLGALLTGSFIAVRYRIRRRRRFPPPHP